MTDSRGDCAPYASASAAAHHQGSRAGPYELYILALSLGALLILAWEVVSTVDAGTRAVLDIVDELVCVAFFLDFVASLARARHRWRYLATWGWLDLLSSIPILPTLRVGRAARVMRALRVLRAIRATRAIGRVLLERRAQSAVLSAVLLSLLFVAVGSIAALHFEHAEPQANIQTAGDAVWWALSTITTVGYGDRYPITPEGRAVAVALMVVGVGIVATVSGLMAAWFLAPSARAEGGELRELTARVQELKELVSALHARDARK